MVKLIKYYATMVDVRQFKQRIKNIAMFNFYNDNKSIVETRNNIARSIFNKVYNKELKVDDNSISNMSIDELHYLNDNLKTYNSIYSTCCKYDHNKNVKSWRLAKRIEEMISCTDNLNISQYIAFFATFTFNQEFLKNSTHNSRQRYIKKFLQQHSFYRIANIDYGDQNHREHYHAIILVDIKQVALLQLEQYKKEHWFFVNDGKKYYKGGFYYLEQIVNNGCDKMGKYITKLERHAQKDSTQVDSLIFSNNLDELHDIFVEHYWKIKSIKDNLYYSMGVVL